MIVIDDYYYVLQNISNITDDIKLSNMPLIVTELDDTHYKMQLIRDLNFSMTVDYDAKIQIRMIAIKKTNRFLYDWHSLYDYLKENSILDNDKYIEVFTIEYNLCDYDKISGVNSISNGNDMYNMFLNMRKVSNNRLYICHPYIEIDKNFVNL
jgi:hypothetical protein